MNGTIFVAEKLLTQIDVTKDEKIQKILKTTRNRTMKEIHNLVKSEENEQIQQVIVKIQEKLPKTNTKMFEAVKNLSKGEYPFDVMTVPLSLFLKMTYNKKTIFLPLT